MQRRDALTVTAPIVAASAQPEITWLNQSKIRRDGATQLRIKLDAAAVHRYAERWAAGSVPPNVTVFYDGTDYWLGDGFHRVASATEKEKILAAAGTGHYFDPDPLIPCDVRAGTRRDAQLHAASANRDHGVTMTDDDIRNAVDTLLRDEEWAGWSDREIARRVGCSPTTVGKRRALRNAPAPTVHVDSNVTPPAPTPMATTRTYERNGKTQTMKVGNLQKPIEKPLATLDEVIAATWATLKNLNPISQSNAKLLDMASAMTLVSVKGNCDKHITFDLWEAAKDRVVNELAGRVENERKTAMKAAKQKGDGGKHALALKVADMISSLPELRKHVDADLVEQLRLVCIDVGQQLSRR